jgi:hypothetical protein
VKEVGRKWDGSGDWWVCPLDVNKRPRWLVKTRTRWLKKRARLERESGFNVGNDGERVGK